MDANFLKVIDDIGGFMPELLRTRDMLDGLELFL